MFTQNILHYISHITRVCVTMMATTVRMGETVIMQTMGATWGIGILCFLSKKLSTFLSPLSLLLLYLRSGQSTIVCY
jgi:hypothetical protein